MAFHRALVDGAGNPVMSYQLAGAVEGLPSGVYRYRPAGHDLVLLREGDARADLAQAALGQTWMKRAPIMIAVAAVYERTTGKYGSRGEKYTHIEVGAATQNLCLQAVALELATTVVGAFEDRSVKRLLGLAPEEKPMLLIPVGRPE